MREYTDIQQICLNGHQVNVGYTLYADKNRNHCPKCGADTIVNCPKCAAPIPGGEFTIVHELSGKEKTIFRKNPGVPGFCGNCGIPFPWEEAKGEEIKVAKHAISKDSHERALNRFTSNLPLAFISYAHEDEMAARKLYSDLKKSGANPWRDKECLLPGQKWEIAIKQAIKKSDFFIAVLSSNSVEKIGYVQKEITQALDILDEFPESRVFIIPIRLDECNPSHEKLKGLHWADMFPIWDNGLVKILSVLNGFSPSKIIDQEQILLHVPKESNSESPLIGEESINQNHNELIKFLECLIQKDVQKSDRKLCFQGQEVSDDQIIKLATNALKRAKSSYEKGLALVVFGDFGEAETQFSNSIEHDPENAKYYLERGNAIYFQNRFKEACNDYSEAIKFDPNFSGSWSNKAAAMGNLGRFKEMLEASEKAISLDPNYAFAWVNKASALSNLGMYVETLEASEKAINLDPDFAIAWAIKAGALDNPESYEQALKASEKAISLDPNLAIAWNNKVSVLIHMNRYKEALEASKMAISLDPNLAIAWANKACALVSMGSYEEAREASKKAIKLDPNLSADLQDILRFKS